MRRNVEKPEVRVFYAPRQTASLGAHHSSSDRWWHWAMAMAEKRLPRSLSGCLEPPSAEPALDPSLLVPAQMSYRSTGLGFYAIAVRCCTMPLEKLAMIMNSAQVSGQGQMRQARSLTRSRTPTRP